MRTADLMLHVGANKVDAGALGDVPTPASTATWTPIPHAELLGAVRRNVEATGLRVIHEAHGLGQDGARYFGLLQVANGRQHEDYTTVIGLRNSHDKVFPAGLAVGSQVFVCDNLSFSGEVKIARKHTRHILRDLPNLIERAVGRLGDLRMKQDRRIEAYKERDLGDRAVHDLLVRSLDARVIPSTRLPKVLAEWREPQHEEFRGRRNVWRLFNAFTETMKGSGIFRMPKTTQALHGLMDGACGGLQN